MGRDLRIFLRRLIGFGLWWLAFLQGFSTHATVVFVIVSAISLLFWFATFIRRKLPYSIAAVCYVGGLITMLCLTSGSWLFNGILWGVLLTLSLFIMAVLRSFDSLRNQGSALKARDEQTKFTKKPPLLRFIIFYIIWFTGLILITVISTPWQAAIVIGWTCAMLILGSNQIWPFAAYPEWLGYSMRRQIFISKKRWIFRFLTTGLLLLLCIISMILMI